MPKPIKYFIYAGGRWCEVDTRRGRVEGFRQRARFCYFRGGRLEVGRTSAVLRALRALATGAGGAARDSAPLQYRLPNKCDLNANELASKPLQAQASTSRKRKRSISEESHGKTKVSKTEEKGARSPQKLAGARGREQECVKNLLNDEENNSPQKKIVKIRGKEEEKLVQSLLKTSSSEDNEEPKPRSKPGPKCSKQSSGETCKSPQKAKVRGKDEKRVRTLVLSSSEDDQVDKTRTKPTQSKPDSNSESSESKDAREMCKELVIDVRDVRILRGFLGRSAGGGELDRFDKDEEYKTRVFYKLNPLVCLKRCGPLEKLLTQRLTLKEFARHLGLRSVADVTPEKRYRMRNSTRQARNTVSVTSDSEKEKDAVQPKRRQLWNRDKQAFSQSSRSSEIKVKPQIHRPARDSSRDTTDSDTEVKKHIRRHLERRASAKINPERNEATNKKDNSIVVESDSDEASSDDKRRNPRHMARATNKDLVMSDEHSSTDGKRRITRRTSKVTKEDDKCVVVTDENSSTGVKQRITKRVSKGAKQDDESVVISDGNTSSTNVKQIKTRRKSYRTKADDEIDKPKTKSRTKSKTVDDNGSVVISDESDSNTDENDSNTDENDYNTDENTRRSSRRTRSQGPDKRLLREHNKSLIISDSDSNTNDRKTRTETKETDKKQNKSDVISESNTDLNKEQNLRTRSRGPNKALKEDNKIDSNAKKRTDRKSKEDGDSFTETRKNTRSSMRLTENEPKKDKTELKRDAKPTSSRTEYVANKRRDEKPGPSKRDAKENNKIETDKDKSVISDSSDAFETSKISPKKLKNVANIDKESFKRNLSLNSDKDRLLKQKQDYKNKSNENDKLVKENEGGIERTGQKEREKDKRTNNETDKDINKVLRDRIDKDKDEQSKGDSNRTENRGKENSRKAAAAKSMFVKPVKFKKSSVANGREYTSLEDHAIVAWVSVGNRERMVNGNVVWRELQSEYPRLTSQTRSWHSLRNRYLRYILPSLGRLALPPAQVSRLRAAAAVGNIKSATRRNSIFKQQRVLSAATAGRIRFRPVSSSDSDEPSDDKRAPTPPSLRRRSVAPSKALSSPSKAPSSPSKTPSSPSKAPSTPSKAPSSPSKATSTPHKVPPASSKPPPSKPTPPKSPRATRLRSRLSTATPTPKKRRIHHL